MALSGIIYYEGEQSHYRHCTSGVIVSNTWFLISDTKILKNQECYEAQRLSVFLTY